MRRFPKYIVLPLCLLIYFVAMAVLGIHTNHGHLPDNFWLIVAIEAVVLIALFLVLRHRRK